MDFVTNPADGIRIAYERVGDGVPVVLVHGFGSSKTDGAHHPQRIIAKRLIRGERGLYYFVFNIS